MPIRDTIDKGGRQFAAQVRARSRFADAPRDLLPYLVPGLAEALELSETPRRRLARTQGVEDLSTTLPPKDIEQHQLCPLCGHDGVRVLHHPSRRERDGSLRWQYHAGRCANCSLLYRVPGIKPTRVPELYQGGNYSAFLEGKYLAGRRSRYQRTLAAFGPTMQEGKGRRLLDFGCGTGGFIELALELGYDAFGVDLAPDAVEVANERLGGLRAWCGNPHEIDAIAEGEFDVITLWSVLAHFADPVDQLASLRRLLRPGGVLLIYTVNAQSLELKAHQDRWNGFTRNHLMFWQPQTVLPLLRRAGFEGAAIAPYLPAAIELDRWTFSERDRQRVIDVESRYRNGNMMRVAALNGPAEQAGLAGSVRL